MTDIITTLQLASYLRDDTATGAAADLVVELANAVVTAAIGDLDPTTPRVRAITFEVASRSWRNPGGYSSETIDDYTYRRDSDTRQAGVYLTPGEAAELARLAGKGGRGAYSIVVRSPLDMP